MKNGQEIIPAQEIIERVCKVLKANMQEIQGPVRNKQNSEIRFILFKLLKQQLNLSYKNIGGLFNRNYSTVIHGVNIFKNLVFCRDKAFLAKIEKVESEFPEFRFFEQPTLETALLEMETVQQGIIRQLNQGRCDFDKHVLYRKLSETLLKKEIIYKKLLKQNSTHEENEKRI